MITPAHIITTSWIIFLLYWAISGLFVKSAQEIKLKLDTSAWNIAGRLFLVFLAIESFHQFPLPVLTFSLFPTTLLTPLGATITILGLIIALIARYTLATNWSSNVELKKDHKLMTKGIYAVTRHPIYTGMITMALGLLLFSGTISSLLFFGIMTTFLMYKSKLEESLLIKHFPKDYPNYMKKVKSLIPFIY